jgi:hypothetical protein
MQQQKSSQPRYSLPRRLFFPYSGERPLTHREQRRVIVTWATVFPVILYVCTLPLVAALYADASVQTVLLISLLVLLGGALLFSLMAWFVIWAVNQTARQVQRSNESRIARSARNSNSSGG